MDSTIKSSFIKPASTGAQSAYPLVITPESGGASIEAWFGERSQDIVAAARLHGAVLFRGFGVDSPGALADAVAGVLPARADYRGGTSPRTKIDDGVYTSTEYPQQYEISLHNEMSYSHQAPEFIFFSCVIAPGEQGETPIADCRRVLAELPAHIVSEFRDRGVMYERNLFARDSRYNSWAKAFETTDPEVVEQHCRDADIEFEWLPGDKLRTREIRPAICVHPVTGEPVWFNQVNLWHYTNSPLMQTMSIESQRNLPMNAYFGDGGELDPAMLGAIRAAYAEHKTLFQWQQGDFLMLDNVLSAHGRMPFTGPRKIIVAMGSTT